MIVVVDWMEARMLTSLTALLSERNKAKKGQKAARDLSVEGYVKAWTSLPSDHMEF